MKKTLLYVFFLIIFYIPIYIISLLLVPKMVFDHFKSKGFCCFSSFGFANISLIVSIFVVPLLIPFLLFDQIKSTNL